MPRTSSPVRRRPSRPSSVVLVLLAVVWGSAAWGAPSAGAQEAPPVVSAPALSAADDQLQCGTHDFTVSERDSDDVTPVYLTPGKGISITADGGIWAGVWFTGVNGPEGWNNLGGAGFPQPSARAFGLLARVGSGSWTYVGRGATTITNSTSSTAPIEFRTNDNTPGNGSGAFIAHYTLCDMSQAPRSQYQYPIWLMPRHARMCAGVTGASTASGADVVQQSCSKVLNQQWTPRPYAGYYQIVSARGGNCLTVLGSYNASDVRQQTCVSGATNQQWSFVPQSDGVAQGWREIVSRSSGRCLDVEAISTADGANVFTWDCLDGLNQQWAFTLPFVD